MGERDFPELMNWPLFCFNYLLVTPGEGSGHPLRYSCLENPTGSRAWRATVPGVARSRPRPSDCRTHAHTLASPGLSWRSLVPPRKESAPFLRRAPRPCRRHELDPWVAKMPWRRKWQIHQSREDSSVNPYTSITNVIDDQHALSVFVCPQLLGF